MHDELEVQVRVEERSKRSRPLTYLVILYVAVVLGVDTLATIGFREPLDWSMFNWGPREMLRFLEWTGLQDSLGWLCAGNMRSFDWFKFIAWFLVPFLLSLPWMVWRAFSFHRWKERDWWLLFLIGGCGLGAMYIIPMVPALREAYPDLSNIAAQDKNAYVLGQLVWILSWLPGWEFLHRYFLLDRVSLTWPRFGWLLLPLAEGLYHLQKPGLEAAAMVVFSIFLTRWAIKRSNVLLPFLAHLMVEVDVVIFMLYL